MEVCEVSELPRSRHSSAHSGRSSRSASSSLRHSNQLFTKPFGFSNKTNFNANDNLVLTRSDSYIPRKPPLDDNPWKRSAPDFRPQVWRPSPPKRNTQDSMMPWKYDTYPGDYMKRPRKSKAPVLPHLLLPERPASPKIVTRFRIPDPYEAKILFVKHGVYPKGQYQMPKPHDFRGYPPLASLGLSEFDVFYDHDPYNLKFKTERINTLFNLRAPPDYRSMGKQIGEPMKPQPHYEADLIMTPDPWPNKSAAYTRHRRLGRTPHSALMERIEDRLSRKWEKERESGERIQRELDEERRQMDERAKLESEVEAAIVAR